MNSYIKTLKNKFQINKEGSNRRLVVKSRKKIFIIIGVITVLATSLGVGLYFAFRTVTNYPDKLQEINSKNTKKKIVNTFGNDKADPWGLYMGSTDCGFCNKVIHGGDGSDSKLTQGYFSQYITSSQLNWYRLDDDGIDEQRQKLSNILAESIIESEDIPEEDKHNSFDKDIFGFVDSSWTTSELDTKDNKEVFDNSNQLSFNNVKDDDGNYTDDWNSVIKNGDSFGTPLFMIFANGKIQTYVKGYVDPDAEESNGEGNNKEWYEAWEEKTLEYIGYVFP